MKTIDVLFDEFQMTIEDLAEKAGMDVGRIEAVVMGRWLPSPVERKKLAAVFDTPIDEISWGHTMDPRNVRYRRMGLKEDF